MNDRHFIAGMEPMVTIAINQQHTRTRITRKRFLPPLAYLAQGRSSSSPRTAAPARSRSAVRGSRRRRTPAKCPPCIWRKAKPAKMTRQVIQARRRSHAAVRAVRGNSDVHAGICRGSGGVGGRGIWQGQLAHGFCVVGPPVQKFGIVLMFPLKQRYGPLAWAV